MADGETRLDVRHADSVVVGDQNKVIVKGRVTDPGRRKFVLVGFTPELALYPKSKSKSFREAARKAVKKVGYEFAELPGGQLSAEQYRQRLNGYHVHVSLLGFCYGPLVADDETRSYARLAYDSAAGSQRPHYVIVINAGEYEAPHSFFFDGDEQHRQERFRREVLASDTMHYEVNDPDQLETTLFNVLHKLSVSPGAQPAPEVEAAPAVEVEAAPAVEVKAAPALDVKAAAVAVGLGVAGLLVLWLAVPMSIGWAAGIAALATVGTYLGGRLTKSPSPD